MNNVILYARTSTKKQNIKEQLQSLINTKKITAKNILEELYKNQIGIDTLKQLNIYK